MTVLTVEVCLLPSSPKNSVRSTGDDIANGSQSLKATYKEPQRRRSASLDRWAPGNPTHQPIEVWTLGAVGASASSPSRWQGGKAMARGIRFCAQVG